MSIWNDRRVDELRGLAIAGYSAAEAAAEMKTTRNAILGAAHRNGLQFGGGSHNSHRPARPRAPRSSGKGPERKGGLNLARLKSLTSEHAKPAATPPPAAPNPCSIMELSNESCRWLDMDAAPWLYCGALEADFIGDVPYCRRHARMAYRRPGEAAA